VLGRAAPHPAPAGHDLGVLEVCLGLLTALSAAGLAGVFLGRLRGVTIPAGLVQRGGGALLRLRRLHSGQVGDYVAWAVLGFAVLGGSLALAI
jgi:hypothetical protein